jgi:DNA polymerase III alpha subunit (gram-positive type)
MSESYKGYKYCFLDVETTGLDRKLHNIFQISGIITDDECNVLENFDFKFRPYSLEHVENGALEATGMTVDSLNMLSMTAAQAYTSLIQVFSRHCNKYDKKDKMHFVGYNAAFDNDFMREFFSKHNDAYFGSWFWNPSICVMNAAAWFTQRVRGAFPNFKLGTICVCAEIGWDEEKAHDAQYDILQTLELFKYLKNNLTKL